MSVDRQTEATTSSSSAPSAPSAPARKHQLPTAFQFLDSFRHLPAPYYDLIYWKKPLKSALVCCGSSSTIYVASKISFTSIICCFLILSVVRQLVVIFLSRHSSFPFLLSLLIEFNPDYLLRDLSRATCRVASYLYKCHRVFLQSASVAHFGLFVFILSLFLFISEFLTLSRLAIVLVFALFSLPAIFENYRVLFVERLSQFEDQIVVTTALLNRRLSVSKPDGES